MHPYFSSFLKNQIQEKKIIQIRNPIIIELFVCLSGLQYKYKTKQLTSHFCVSDFRVWKKVSSAVKYVFILYNLNHEKAQ